jgi:hypothetical protein
MIEAWTSWNAMLGYPINKYGISRTAMIDQRGHVLARAGGPLAARA